MDNCIIYAFKDPRTDEYKYVGKSVNGMERAKTHFVHSHNPMVNEWVRELNVDNFTPDIDILENVTDWRQLADKEKYWIGKLINQGFDLFNVATVNTYQDNMAVYEAINGGNLDEYRKILEGKEKYYKQLIAEKVLFYEEKMAEVNRNFLMKCGSVNTLSEVIKTRRKDLKIQQSDLAEISGVGLRTIKEIERNQGNPTLKTVSKILDCLGFDINIKLKELGD